VDNREFTVTGALDSLTARRVDAAEARARRILVDDGGRTPTSPARLRPPTTPTPRSRQPPPLSPVSPATSPAGLGDDYDYYWVEATGERIPLLDAIDAGWVFVEYQLDQQHAPPEVEVLCVTSFTPHCCGIFYEQIISPPPRIPYRGGGLSLNSTVGLHGESVLCVFAVAGVSVPAHTKHNPTQLTPAVSASSRTTAFARTATQTEYFVIVSFSFLILCHYLSSSMHRVTPCLGALTRGVHRVSVCLSVCLSHHSALVSIATRQSVNSLVNSSLVNSSSHLHLRV